jgi:outer membrane usher protein
MSREPTANRRWRASRRPIIHIVAVVLLAAGGLNARAAGNVAPNPGPPAEHATPGLAQAAPGVEVTPPLEEIIVTLNVNGVARGTAPVLRDQKGRFFVPVADFRSWGLAVPGGAALRLQGIEHVDLGRIPELQARFDEKRVALEVTVAAEKLPKNTIDLRWRYPDALRPTQPSAFFNYALSVFGDESFGSSRTLVTTEAGGRMGDTLLYSSGTYTDQAGDRGYTRLQTNLTYDRRDSLQRLIAGDFFTPVRELSASFPMGGLSFTKYYPLDPYFIQYPTLSLNTTAALPSQVEVRIDGNVVARQQVQPGPIDIVNVTGYQGARNVQVVVRDAFGREQVIQQPFYFTDFALKQGMHDYSYNLGSLRNNYGISSDDYDKPAFTGFHRYGFTDRLTLGLRGEAGEGMVNAGPIGTVLLPGAGIVGAGVGEQRRGQHRLCELTVLQLHRAPVLGEYQRAAFWRRLSAAAVRRAIPDAQLRFRVGRLFAWGLGDDFHLLHGDGAT